MSSDAPDCDLTSSRRASAAVSASACASEFVEAEVALPNAVCEGRGVWVMSDVSAPALKRSACSSCVIPDSVDNRITAFE